MRITTVVGARPQFIKAATISRSLRRNSSHEEFLIHTGQHYDEMMSAVFFKELEMPQPDIDLGIGSGPHGAQTAAMMSGIEESLLAHSPDLMLVYGDTNSTLAAALVAAKLHVPVAHVEAGLRSFNRKMPEEVNRIIADHLSEILFVPTQAAIQNLRTEGLQTRRIELVGDVMYDASLHAAARLGSKMSSNRRAPYALVTIHRAENTDDVERLAVIVTALSRLSDEIEVLWLLHPRTDKQLDQTGLRDRLPAGVRLSPPVGYFDMVELERGAQLIITDSGGVQKEAYFQRVPCVTLRSETEWVELVETGWNKLAPPVDVESVLSTLRAGLTAEPGADVSLYGDGKAASRILAALEDFLA